MSNFRIASVALPNFERGTEFMILFFLFVDATRGKIAIDYVAWTIGETFTA